MHTDVYRPKMESIDVRTIVGASEKYQINLNEKWL